ncbi:MAG: IBR domain-containing protein, partial [Actinobacteria bacterium]|nr:IBR domain-containing protein [Actinomycetota bacterium]
MYHHFPQINCSGYLLGVAQMRKAICPVCRLGLCSHCGKKRHSRRTCSEVAHTEMQDSIAVKACPRCACFIEKNHGCNHMTCQVCVHEWCWQCRFPYTITHFGQESADYCPVLRRSLVSVQSPPPPLPDPTQTPVLMSDIGFCKWVLYWLLCCAFSCVLGVIVVCYFV